MFSAYKSENIEVIIFTNLNINSQVK